MSKPATETKTRIIEAANHLFYLKGIKAASVDAIADKAGVTKRTLYYHFRSKNELITTYLTSRDQPNVDAFSVFFDAQEGTLETKIAAIFTGIANVASHPKWRGCGFQRTVGELADKPGHPAIEAASQHKQHIEAWLHTLFIQHNLKEPTTVARQVSILIEGALATMLIHRNRDYIDQAGRAAITLIHCHLDIPSDTATDKVEK